MSESQTQEPGNFEIPKNLQEVIDRLPPQTPEDFKKSAKIAAQYITELDAGSDMKDEGAAKFKEELAHTGFIGSVYLHHSLKGIFNDPPDPKDALPSWLYVDKRGPLVRDKEDEEIERGIKEDYGKWISKPIFTREDNKWGTFYGMGGSDESIVDPRRFKAYIEGDDLVNGLKSGDLQEVIHKLKLSNLNPDTMKLFEGARLVLYFGRDIKLADEIREQFKSYDLKFRGPAQDVYQVSVTEDGSLDLDTFTSNDGSLGEGGHTVVQYNLRKYDPAQFLDNYLQLCLYAGKAPDEPYKTSFVWLMDREGKAKGNTQIKEQAEKLAGYPVLYAEHRLNVVRK